MSDTKLDAMGRRRRQSQGGAGPKNLPSKENCVKAGLFDHTVPGHLGPAGAEWWQWATATLEKMGILDAADIKHIELCAETYEDYRAAQDDIEALGRICAQTTDGGTIYRRNPAFVTMEKARVMLRSFYSDLGLTPSARAKFGDQDAGEDPFLKIASLC